MGCVENITAKTSPEQDEWLGKRTLVCFHYDPSAMIGGVIVRRDGEAPFKTIIKLDDGRYVLTTECMHSPQD